MIGPRLTIAAAIVTAVVVTAAAVAGILGLDVSLGLIDPRVQASAPVLDLEAPAVIAAGEPATVVVTSLSATGSLPVVVRAGTTTHRFTVEVEAGLARLELDQTLTGQAGVLDLRAGSLATTIEITPGPVVGDFPVLAGPHTVVANGADHAVAVAIPRDRWGNPAASGTEVVYTWTQPGPGTSTGSSRVDRGIAWVELVSGTKSGWTGISAAAESAVGVEARITEVPGAASQLVMEPVVVVGSEVGDAVELRSGPIADRFGNTIPDGVEGRFGVETARGPHIVPGTVQGGRLRAWWVPVPGAITISAAVNGVSSPPLTMTVVEDQQK
ncbi:MAG: hypothetical protein HKN94_06625 [Acidimicrobiales bacterium]|nr:hypothetical protein [Acidimicrobiales bacterium]